MESEVLALGKDIERMERQAILDAQLAKPVTPAITNTPGTALNAEKTGRASEAYRSVMLKALRTNFRQVENILRSLATVITTSGEHKINIAVTKPVASWIEEGASLNF